MALRDMIDTILKMKGSEWIRGAFIDTDENGKDVYCDIGYILKSSGLDKEEINCMNVGDAGTFISERWGVTPSLVKDMVSLNDRALTFRRHRKALRYLRDHGDISGAFFKQDNVKF